MIGTSNSSSSSPSSGLAVDFHFVVAFVAMLSSTDGGRNGLRGIP
jgi:hypothetical protein